VLVGAPCAILRMPIYSLHDDEETSTSYKGKNHLILHLLMKRQALLTREKKHLILHLLMKRQALLTRERKI